MTTLNLQRRHYEFIADVIESLDAQGLTTGQAHLVARVFSQALAVECDNFNRDRFLTACGVGEDHRLTSRRAAGHQ